MTITASPADDPRDPRHLRTPDDIMNDGSAQQLLALRTQKTDAVIKRYAGYHGVMAVGVAGVGTFLPGMAVPALLANIAAQGPVIYSPMVREIAAIYQVDAATLRTYATEQLPGRVAVSGLVDVGAMLAEHFGSHALTQLATNYLIQHGLVGVLGSFIPVLGGVVSASVGNAIGQRMTRHIGCAVAVYFRNGQAWVGSQAETMTRVRGFDGELSKIREAMPEVAAREDAQVKAGRVQEIETFLVNQASSLWNIAPLAVIRESLRRTLKDYRDGADTIIERVLARCSEHLGPGMA